MNRLVRFGVAAVAGLVAGAGTMLVVQGGRGLEDGTAERSPSFGTANPATTASVPTRTTTATTGVLLAWTAGGLPAGFADAVDDLGSTARVTSVLGDQIDLRGSIDASGQPLGVPPPPGMVYPADAIAVDPASYVPFVPRADRAAFRDLGPGEAIVGETSARLREVDVGDGIVPAVGPPLTVVAVVADPLVAAAEVVVAQSQAAAHGITTERYVLVRTAGPPEVAATDIRDLAGPGQALRLRQPGETPYLRSSDAVLPQARIKDVFGEFAYVPPAPGTREFAQDPAWAAAHIVTVELPVIGRIRCHRALVPALRGAMEELAERNLAGLVHSTQGCHNPRLIRAGGEPSRHAWGAAVDLNVGSNPTGVASIQDDRLVAVMERWGFVSGDDWLVPDPGHFEYVGPPRG